ncbi:MAG: DUF4340 domain-containing protein [Chloroflexota bacterium]
MQKRLTWILVLAFLALLALLLWMPRWQEALVEPTETPTPSAALLFDVTPEQIVGMRIVSAEGKAFEVERDESGSWIAPGMAAIDSTAIDSSIDQFVGTQVLNELAEPSDLSLYGLSYPVGYVLTIRFLDGSTHILAHGDVTPTGQGYYALIDNTRLVILSKYSLGRLLDFVDNPPVLATPTTVPAAVPTTAP